MSLTYLEAAKTERDPLRLGLIRELSEGELLGIVPFEDVDGGGVFYEKEGELPGVAFRGINENYDASIGVINPEAEQLKPLGSDTDVDTFILNTKGEDARTKQIQMKMRSMRMTFEDKFINGDESVNPREFDGLRRRINPGSSQAVSMGGALSLMMLDELIDATDASGGNKVLVMNRRMRRLLTQASRNSSIGGFINYDQDQFGRKVRFYNETPIVTLDVNSRNQQILGFTETAGGAATGGSSTSIYCVALGDNLVTGLHGAINGQYGPAVRPMGEVPDSPVDRTRFEWYCGMAVYSGRAASRLYGITNATIVA